MSQADFEARLARLNTSTSGEPAQTSYQASSGQHTRTAKSQARDSFWNGDGIDKLSDTIWFLMILGGCLAVLVWAYLKDPVLAGWAVYVIVPVMIVTTVLLILRRRSPNTYHNLVGIFELFIWLITLPFRALRYLIDMFL